MRGERRLLRIGEYLVGRACQRLPRDVREDRHREWIAELPAILHDPQVKPAPWRAARMLAYAADTLRGATLAPGKTRRPAPGATWMLCLLLLGGLGLLAHDIWLTVKAPGDGLNYAQVAWSLLLVVYPASALARSSARINTLIVIVSSLAAEVVFLWNAAQAPGDWVNYFVASCFFLAQLVLLRLVWRLPRRRARTRRA
jgi:hypothetical protein